MSVPLVYPALLYLLARALWIGLRGRGEGLRPVWPAAWLLVAALFLMGFRVGLNMADSGAIDVGYAGVVGADRIAHGEPLYDNFPNDVSQGDTYGPVNYLAYVPFERIWPWSGSWNDLPAAHGAAVTFDLLAFALLIWLGLRIRPGPAGRKLAATLAFGWAAYPYTAYALESNSNDTLVAVLLIAVLLALARPIARGVLAALASADQVRADRPGPDADDVSARGSPYHATRGSEVRTRLPVHGGGVTRVAGNRPGPAHLLRPHHRLPGRPKFTLQHLGTGGWAGAAAHRASSLHGIAGAGVRSAGPGPSPCQQVAALGAALLIALQLTAHHWFYLYIVWFFPLLLGQPRPRSGQYAPGHEEGQFSASKSPKGARMRRWAAVRR